MGAVNKGPSLFFKITYVAETCDIHSKRTNEAVDDDTHGLEYLTEWYSYIQFSAFVPDDATTLSIICPH